MEKCRLFILFAFSLICSSLMAGQADIKAMTEKDMETVASQAYLQQILSIDSFQNADDCRNHRKDALMCANYILDNPCESNEKNDLMWVYCARYVLLWDEKSDEILISYPKSSQTWMISTEMLSVFLSACTKIAIEDKIIHNYSKELHVKAITACVQYYIKHKKIMDLLCMPNMKKMVKKYRRGRLEKYLSQQYDEEYAGKPQPENFFIPE